MSNYKFDWQKMIASEKGPKSPTTRHILLSLSLYMDESGSSCYPSTRTIATDTGLSERVVCKHLSIAAENKWILKATAGINGQGWKRNSYTANIPKALTEGQHLNPKGTDAESAPLQEGTDPNTKGTDPGDKKALTQGQSNSQLTVREQSNTIYDFYVSEIQPARKSKTRAVKNIRTYLKRKIPFKTLKAAVINYKKTLNGTDPKFRKDPANFFGNNEPYAVDFYPENFKPGRLCPSSSIASTYDEPTCPNCTMTASNIETGMPCPYCGEVVQSSSGRRTRDSNL